MVLSRWHLFSACDVYHSCETKYLLSPEFFRVLYAYYFDQAFVNQTCSGLFVTLLSFDTVLALTDSFGCLGHVILLSYLCC